jgi:hypothetical protein
MPPQPKSLSARLRQLESAKARANALPRGATVSFEPMREILGLATRTSLREWCDSIDGFEASGAFVRGGNGVEWEFDPRKTVAFLVKHFKGRIQSQANKTRRVVEAATGIEMPGDEVLGFQEVRQALEAARAIKREKRIEGEHCRKDHVEWLFDTSMERKRSRVMSIITKVDPNGNWLPKQRQEIDRACREALLEMYEDDVELKEEFDARVQQQGSV